MTGGWQAIDMSGVKLDSPTLLQPAFIYAALMRLRFRSGLVFDPYEAYGGDVPGGEQLSYVDIIINPLLAALNEVLTKNTKVRHGC